MKNKTVPLAIGVGVLGCVLAVSANLTTQKLGKNLDDERSKRIMAERDLQKSQQEVSGLQAALGEAKSKMASIEKILTDGDEAKQELLSELQAVKSEREALKVKVESLDVEGSEVLKE